VARQSKAGEVLGQIAYRVATDPQWAPESQAYRRTLWRWSQSLAEPIETPDVLRSYAAQAKHARQMLLAGKNPGVASEPGL
jgi:hypothetical protein